MNQMEIQWDKLLKIKTTGRDDTNANHFNYPYEPTPYSVLERLTKEGYIGKKDVVLDYGCGKGRVEFFLAYQTKARIIGIEYDGRIYTQAVANKESAVSGGRVEFRQKNAAEFEVPKEVNRCYFFNPFSVEILRKVLAKIKESYYACPREILLFFYYPSDEYISCLMPENELTFWDEIDCEDLFDGKNQRERILVFRIG